MVKGHTYEEQLFESSAFRHFINVFLNNSVGITKGCEITKSSSTIEIGPGFFVVGGGLLEEDTGTSNTIPTEAGYYKLVYEIDLSKTNTEQEFNQGSYKFVKGVGGYPSLTQNDLDNGGTIYQYPFCQFRVTESGMTDFKDLRTFLDYVSIFEEIRKLITEIADESYYVSKIDFKKSKSHMSITHAGQPWIVQTANVRAQVPFNKTKIDFGGGYLSREGADVKIESNVTRVAVSAFISLDHSSPTTGNMKLIIARKRGETVTEYAAISSFHIKDQGENYMSIPEVEIDVQRGDLIGLYFVASNSGNFIVNANNIYSALNVSVVE